MATKIRLESQVQGTLPEANAPASLTKTPSVSTTEVASQGGLLINIDSASGTTATSVTSGNQSWVEDEKYGVSIRSAGSSVGTTSGQFVPGNMTGSKVFRFTISGLSNTGTTFCRSQSCFGAADASISQSVLSKNGFPLKPNTKYRFIHKYRINSFTAVGTIPGVAMEIATYNSSGTRLAEISDATAETVSGTYLKTIEFTSGATGAYAVWASIMRSGNGEIDLDVNSFRFEEITEPVTNSLTSKSPSLVGFTAVGSTDNVDQSATTITTNVFLGGASGQYLAQQFMPSKKDLTGIILRREVNNEPFTSDVTVSIQTDNANKPSGTILSQYTIPNATWGTIATNTDYTVNLPTDLIVDGATKYWIVFKVTTDGSNLTRLKSGTDTYTGFLTASSADGITWSTGNSDFYFKTLYYKPSTNFTARQNNDVVSISADSDGFLEGAKIDLENGTFSWDSGIGTTAYDTKPYNSAYFRTVGTWGLTTSNRLLSGSTNAELIYKIPSWVNASVNFLSTDSGGSFVTISASTDGVTYNAIAPAAYDVSAKIPFGSAFLKITANGPNAKAEKLEINGTFDTSSFKTLYNFPTNQNLYDTYVKTLATATTTATYRATKYGFPAIEFADGVYTFLKVDTTATGSTVAFSANGTTYTTVADGANIALTSNTYPIVYVRSNITANRLYVSSNDYNADSAKDGSLKCNVQYKTLTQGLIYDVQELQNEISELKAAIAALQAA